MTNEELIQTAASRLNWKKTGDFLFADVACALETGQGNIYTGVVLGTYIPLCAEQSAVAAMVTAGEYKIKKIVAVWRSEQGELKGVVPET